MENDLTTLSTQLLELYKQTAPNERLIVAVAGVPGSGKSTLAYPLVDRLNALLGLRVTEPAEIDLEELVAEPGGSADQDKNIAVAVGLDGWHYSLAELDQFPDPLEARRRRGAAFTFDAPSYVTFVRALRQSPLLPSIPFRTFDHALKDPQPAAFAIEPHHRIVVVEGLYTLLNVEPWKEATDLLDVKVWVECERAVARERLVRRHLVTGVETERDKAEARVDLSDMLNGEYVRDHLTEPTFSFHSIEDANFAMA